MDSDGIVIDSVYEIVDELLLRGLYPLCDELLRVVYVRASSTDSLLTLLTATLAAHDKLPYREQFFKDVSFVLKQRREPSNILEKATEELIQYWRQNGKCVCCGGWWGGEYAIRKFSEALGYPPVEDI
jgi:hypothetical protein